LVRVVQGPRGIARVVDQVQANPGSPDRPKRILVPFVAIAAAVSAGGKDAANRRQQQKKRAERISAGWSEWLRGNSSTSNKQQQQRLD
jgi:hypothetical protein